MITSHWTQEQNNFHTNKDISARNKTHSLGSTERTSKIMSKKFPEHRLLKTCQSLLQCCSNLGGQHNVLQICLWNQSKGKFEGSQSDVNSPITNFSVLATPRQIKQMLDKFTLKLIMRILWSEPWKAVLMNFSADTLISLADLETGHRSIFNPLLLFHAKKSSLKHAGTRARFFILQFLIS